MNGWIVDANEQCINICRGANIPCDYNVKIAIKKKERVRLIMYNESVLWMN